MVECEFYPVNFLFPLRIPVLIDTWWNVNKFIYTVQAASDLSFNRYMVECEFYLCNYSQN